MAATNPVRFLVKSVLDSATMSYSTETDGLPVENVQNQLIRKVYRTTGKGSRTTREFARFDAGAATGMNCLFIGLHNFTKNATVYWEGDATDNFTGASLSVQLTVSTDGLGEPIKKLAYFWPSVESYRHWRLLFQDNGNASSTIEVGRIMAGRYIQPTRNMRDGFGITRIDPSRARATAGRQGYANERDKFYEFTYSVYNHEEAQMDEMIGIYNTVGKWKPFVMALDPVDKLNDHTIYTQFESDLGYQQTVMRQYGLQTVTFGEKI